MPANQKRLSANQQAMLDLALSCDLKMAPLAEQEFIRARHAKINTQADAVVYIRSVEHKVQSRRKILHLQGKARTPGPAFASAYRWKARASRSRPLLSFDKGDIDDEFKMEYFRLVVGQYLTMNNKADDPAAEAEAQQLIALDPEQATWEDVYRLELAILKLEPLPSLCRKAWVLRQEYSEIASVDEKNSYALSKPPLAEDPNTVNETLLRADLVRLQEELNWAYTVMWIQEEFRSQLTWQIIGWVLGAIVVFAMFAMVSVRFVNASQSVLTVGTVIFAGFMGGAISAVRKIQSANLAGNADLNLLQLERGNSSVIISPFLGAVFALVLLYMLAGGLLQGAIFPRFTSAGDSFLGFGLDKCSDVAKLLVWSFLAGFAEQFVPDRLDQIAKQSAKK